MCLLESDQLQVFWLGYKIMETIKTIRKNTKLYYNLVVWRSVMV